MADNDTLLAYLIPKLTSQVENASTEALGYILNRSSGAMQALNDLLRESDFDIAQVTRVETQVTYEDGSRPDMAGYDKEGVKRLLVEAKFWAALLKGQASGYAQQFEHAGPSVLLFIAPEVRFATIWAEIERQMREECELEAMDPSPGVQRARVVGTELQLVLVSWVRLLDLMNAMTGDENVKSDIQQLRGLAQSQDSQAFLPVHSEDLSPSLGRRVVWYNQLVDDVVDSRGVPEGWLDRSGLAATSRRWGYGRYVRFSGAEITEVWVGVNHEQWATSGDTPLWLRFYDSAEVDINAISKALKVRVNDQWVPLRIRTGVEYTEVLDDVIQQLKTIGMIVGAHLPAE